MGLCFPNKILQYNTRTQKVKAYRGFNPQPDLGGLKQPPRSQLIGPLSKADFTFHQH